AYSLKEEYEIGQEQIIESIWASDKHSFPIQLSTLTLSNPGNIGKILHIFRSDVIELHAGQTIVFKDPNNGNQVEKQLPKVDYIISNLPFIREKEIKKLNPNIKEINKLIKEQTKAKKTLSKKSDIFAYIPFYLYDIISDNGKIGLILSNAWLGTDYGEIFLELIQKYFNIDCVVISGKGRWFNNAKVVTTLLIATKREISDPVNLDRRISFCTLKEKLENIADIKKLSSEIILNKESDWVNIQSYSINEIKQLENIGIPWSGYFANLNWLPTIAEKLIDSKKFFDFIRGERRGCNRMFYPAKGHGIEDEYIEPVLKNLKKASSFIATSQTQAFCCSKSIEELETLNHTGTLNWIRSFENQMDKTNKKLLPIALRKPNMFWYEMSTKNMADFVVNINFDKSLFIAMLDKRSFFDQRMIGFSIKEQYKDENKIFLLALLNNILSMFFIESFGFGRGLGALDLRETKFKKDFKILNPELLSDAQKKEIIKAFQPIFNRDRLPLEKELQQKDRIDFELMLLKIYGLDKYYDTIKQTLLHLYKTRFAVKEKKRKKA
ncbi:SAM-dependent DNA methyltransferase, partial [Bacteroides ovatus]